MRRCRTAHLAPVLALALAAAACGGDSTETTPNTEPAAGATTPAAPADQAQGTAGTAGAETVRVADLMDAPDKYFGKTVTVVADVEEVLGPYAFALDEDSAVAGGVDNDLLVLSRKAGSLAEIDDQWLNNKVRVTGTVGKMTVVEAEREVGWDLDPHIEIEVEKRGAVLVAQSIQRNP